MRLHEVAIRNRFDRGNAVRCRVRIVTVLAIFALIIPVFATPVFADPSVIGGGMTPAEGAEHIRREMEANRGALRRELESEGFVVSEGNLDRYIDAFAREYQDGLHYVLANMDRIAPEIQRAHSDGATQAQLDQLMESLIAQLMAESGFDPARIARDIFPRSADSDGTPDAPTESPAVPEPPTDSPSVTPEDAAGVIPSEDIEVVTIDDLTASIGDYFSWSQGEGIPVEIAGERYEILLPERQPASYNTYFSRLAMTKHYAGSAGSGGSNPPETWDWLAGKLGDFAGGVSMGERLLKHSPRLGRVPIVGRVLRAAPRLKGVGNSFAAISLLQDAGRNYLAGDNLGLSVAKSVAANSLNGPIQTALSPITLARAIFDEKPLGADVYFKGLINYTIDNAYYGSEDLSDTRFRSGYYGGETTDRIDERLRTGAGGQSWGTEEFRRAFENLNLPGETTEEGLYY